MNSILLLPILFLVPVLTSAQWQPTATPVDPRSNGPEGPIGSYGTGNEAFEAMIDVLVGGAKRVLEERGEFYPAALGVDTAGTLAVIHPYEEGMTVEALVERTREILAAGARDGSFRATGLLLDVYAIPPGATTKTDAMLVRLEDAGRAVHYFLPYAKSGASTVSYGEGWLVEVPAELFRGE